MESQFRKQLKNLLHPYLFILKEGGEIKEDLLDYSLLMLQVECVDKLHSPKTHALSIKEQQTNYSVDPASLQPIQPYPQENEAFPKI